ncbi:hypothetical protein RHO15_07170 [Utexia brackfieldae]|uniref:hypothetical protein n=1 Tax=Utexia brackfieldae TaxID=3074108 RepID=UPI00370DAAB5
MQQNIKLMDLNVEISLLKQSARIDRFSLAMTMLSLLLLMLQSLFADSIPVAIGSLIVFVLGVVQFYFVIRVDFDRRLFKSLQSGSDSEMSTALKALDQSHFVALVYSRKQIILCAVWIIECKMRFI